MDDQKASKSPNLKPVRKKRRVLKALVGLAVFAIAVMAALPWLVSTPPGRAFLVGKVNAQLAPGSIELDGLSLSWRGPIELSGVSLRDPKGKVVLASRRVILDRGIVRLLASRPDYGRVTVEGATIDVERKADGSIDLLDALGLTSNSSPTPAAGAAPVPGPPPTPSPMAVSVVLQGGTLRVASPELVEPFAAASVEGSVTIAPGKPIEVSATLGSEGQSLEIRSTIDPNSTADLPGDQTVSVVGKSWPLHVRQAGVEALGRFEGTLAARREHGLWSFHGDAALLGVEATGPTLQGDHLKLDRLAAACDAGQSASGWTIRKLDMTSPFATLQGSGMVPAIEGTPAQVRGRVDLAALARMLPNAMRLRGGLTLDKGIANLQLDLTTLESLERAELIVSLDDFHATEGGRAVVLRQPVHLTGKAVRAKQKVTVESLEVKAAGVDLTAGGDLEAGVKLMGTFDLVALTAQIRDVLDLGAFNLSGQGRIGADYRHAGDSFKARLAADCKDLKIVGVTAEPIVRDLLRLDGSAQGPSKPDGTPADWHEARLDLKAGDLKADLIATSKDGTVGLVAGLGMDVASPVPGQLAAKANFRRTGLVLEVDELRAGITPTDPKAASGVVALAVKGRLDLASGEGAFGPIPGYAAGAIGLGPEGAKLTGLGRADAPIRVDAALVGDLAALDRLLASWSGSALKGLGGDWSSKILITRSTAGKLDIDGKVDMPAFVATSPRGPVALVVKGGYSPESDRLDLATFDLSTAYGKVTLVGKILETKARKLMDLTGTVEPTWAAIDPLVAASVEPNARVRATIKPIHLAGSLQADTTPMILPQMLGEVALDMTMAEAFGVKLGKTPVVLKLNGGRAIFNPIMTTMNDGPVLIQAELAFDADYGLYLRLNPCRIQDAAINEAVSASILSYVAPVLAKSSGVTGKVTVALNKGLVPITSKLLLSLDGAMAFQDTIFKPGPLGAELTSLTGQAAPNLKLDQTMIFQVANGRVQQTGLSIPLGNRGAKVAIEGSVGFDQSLDLKATIPISARLLGLDASLDKSIPPTSIPLPIRGTLARPAIDQKAFGVALRNATKNLGEKELKSEAGRFLNRIAGQNPPAGEPRTKPANSNPLGDLQDLGREILDPK